MKPNPGIQILKPSEAVDFRLWCLIMNVSLYGITVCQGLLACLLSLKVWYFNNWCHIILNK